MAKTCEQKDIRIKRAEELDALDAILPFDRRDQLAALLTDDDVATLKHLAQQGMGDNTLRALVSDLGYLEAWCQLATGAPLPWPALEALLLKFVAQHLWDPEQWLAAAGIESRPVFRKIDRWGNVDRRALTPQSVNLIRKTRVKQAGLDPAAFSAHGLRSGYLTEAANRGIPLPEAMQQSLH